ncbi:hypothetical protein NR756_18410 [Alloalcanivorax xenomutans]|uniref:hypothetical protein n=1 Tax=Alloalcanivorax xenomutans TaxID=1094342 RepID=UPI003A801B21
MTLSYTRSPCEPGYEMNDTFELEIKNGRSILIMYDPNKNSDLEAGIEAFKATIPDMLRRRQEAEFKAEEAGIPILRDYVDPSIEGIAIRPK